jgi:CTD small phosphatase-like protein 2
LNIRPFAMEFLAKMSNIFEIIIFTASEKSYADSILDHLDPHSKLTYPYFV